MKIIFVNRFFYPDESATSQLLSDLAFYLSAQNLNIEILTSRQRIDDPKASLKAEENIKGVLVRRIWSSGFGRSHLFGRSLDYGTFYLSAFFSLLKNLKKNDVVVAESDPPLISVVAMVAAKIKGAKLINWTQDVFPEVAIKLKVKVVLMFACFFRWVRDLSLKSAIVNVVIGKKMAHAIEERGVDKSRIRVIYNWASGQEIYTIEPKNNALLKEWGLLGKFVVGYSGNMGRAHEFETILGAAQILANEPGIVFLLIGDGKQREWIEDHCSQKNIKNIIFKPLQPVERLVVSLNVAQAHLISLRPELEGLVVPSKFYGILASGRPVLNVGEDFGEIAMSVAKAECGYTVSPGQSQALAEIILSLFQDPVGAAQIGMRGREYFLQKFDRPIALKAWYDVLLVYSKL